MTGELRYNRGVKLRVSGTALDKHSNVTYYEKIVRIYQATA